MAHPHQPVPSWRHVWDRNTPLCRATEVTTCGDFAERCRSSLSRRLQRYHSPMPRTRQSGHLLGQKSARTWRNADGNEEKKVVRLCVTFHEHINGNGIVNVAAGLREIEGQDKKHFLIAMPPDTQVEPAMHALVFPRDVWETLLPTGKLDITKLANIKQLKFGSTSCQVKACTAEIEATPALISDLEAAGGLAVFAVDPSGKTVVRPVSLIDFAKALADPPTRAGRQDDRPIVWAGPDWQCSPICEWRR